MQKTLIICLFTALIGFSAHASDTKEKQLKKLKELVACSDCCGFKLYCIEVSRTKSDSPELKKDTDRLEKKAGEDYCNAIENEFKFREELRSKWALYEEIDAMPNRKPKHRAKL